MYVLHHADKPSLYAGLPDDPQISPLVGLWKGVMKPIALAGHRVRRRVVGFLHWIVAGPERGAAEDDAARRRDVLAERPEMHDEPPRRPSSRYTPAARINHWITAG